MNDEQSYSIGKVAVQASASSDRSYFRFHMQTEDGSPLTIQGIIDVLSDYLLYDPEDLFPPSL